MNPVNAQGQTLVLFFSSYSIGWTHTQWSRSCTRQSIFELPPDASPRGKALGPTVTLIPVPGHTLWSGWSPWMGQAGKFVPKEII